MAMRTKSSINKLQSRKRTLRSSSKQSNQDNNNTGCSSDEKVIDQIKKQIEHQQTKCGSKNAHLVPQDVKVFHQLLSEKQFLAKNDKKAVSTKNKCQTFDNNISAERSPQINLQSNENSLEEKIKVNQKLQKLQSTLMTPPSKTVIRNAKINQNSPYQQFRKSYRKLKRNSICIVPYRKCQDQFEQKIVTLMNKICSKKYNQKDIDNLCEKIQKISNKQIYNPYVISGIQSILNLLGKTHEVNVTCLAKLKSQVQNLSQKIWLELGRTQQYEKIIIQEKQVDIEITKPRMMRKVYKMLIQSRKFPFKQAREKSFYICQSFFDKCNNKARQDDILHFLKQSKFLNF